MKRVLYLALCLFIAVATVVCFSACGDEDSDGGKHTPNTSSSQSNVPTNSSAEGSTDTTQGSTGSTEDTTDSSQDTVDSTEQSSTTASSHDRTDTSSGISDSTNGSTNDSTSSSDTPTTDSSQDSDSDDDTTDDHEHTFADVYSYDGTSHYYAATCEHTDEKKAVESHTYNTDGVCKCGHTIDIEFYNAILSAIANRDAIKSVNSSYMSTNVEFNSVSKNNIIYEFYSNFLYIRDENDNINEYYYSFDSSGELFGICVQNDGQFVFRVDDVTDSNYLGAMYTLSCIDDGETTVFGAESLVEYLYKLGLDNVNGDFTTSDKDGIYSFSYMRLVLDDWMDYLYSINVSFTVDSVTGAMSAVNITVNRYRKSDYTLSEQGIATLNEDVTANKTSTFTITLSDKISGGEMENPYAYEKIAVDSLTVKDGKGNDIQKDDISVRAGESLILYFSDIKPDSALFHLCKVSVSVQNKVDGSEIETAAFFNSYNNSYSLTINTPGAYLLVVNVDDVQFITTVEVDLKIPLTLGTQVYNAEKGEFKQVRKVTAYAGTPVYFKSYVAMNYDGSYRAALASNYGNGVTLTSGELDGQAVSVFKSDTIGTYLVNLTSEIDPYLVTQLKIEVIEAPSLESFLVGEYYANDQFGKEQIRVVFDEENNALVTYHPFDSEETLACSIVNGKLVYESVDGDQGLVTNMYFDESFNLVISIDDSDIEGEIFLTRVKVEAELISTGAIIIKEEKNNVLKYAFEYYSDNSFVIYNGYSLTNEIALFNDNGVLSIRYIGETVAVPMVKISGENGSFAGEYTIESVGEAMISIDKEPTLVREPEFGVLRVIDLNTQDQRYSAYYSYEIVNGKYVFYKDGAVTDEVSLDGEPGLLTFVYPGAAYPITPVKILGEDDVLGGEYNINVSVGVMYTAAKIVFYPGSNMEDIYATSEPKYGSVTVTDADGNNTIYHYEIIDNAFVIYKDERKTNEIVITVKLDGTYTYHTAENPEPLPLVKIDGADNVLAGVYSVGENITLSIFSGNIPSEQIGGRLELIDDHRNGNLSGVYMYSVINGSLVVYDRAGNVVESIKFTTNIDGSYSFQSIENNLLVPQSLIKVDGLTVLFGGVYVVNGSDGTPIYTFTFTPGETIEDVFVESGSVEITDNKDQSIGGSYTYSLTDDGRIILYKDEETVVEFSITIDENGKYLFSSAALEGPIELVKVNGEKDMLSGGYSVIENGNAVYEIVIMADGYVMPEKEEISISIGSNSITVPSNYIGVNVMFTATQDGTYDFNFAGVTSNIKVFSVGNDGSLKPIKGTAYIGVELVSGQSITFYVVSEVAEGATIGLTVSKGISSLPDEEI